MTYDSLKNERIHEFGKSLYEVFAKNNFPSSVIDQVVRWDDRTVFINQLDCSAVSDATRWADAWCDILIAASEECLRDD